MGSKSSTQKVENNPPKWAEPLLREGANEAMNLYKSGKGYGIYQGPTQAQFSPTTLQGMNSLLAATGGGTPITNESVFNTPQIQQAQQAIQQIAAQNAAKETPAPASGGWQNYARQQAINNLYQRMSAGESHSSGLPSREKALKKKAERMVDQRSASGGSLW